MARRGAPISKTSTMSIVDVRVCVMYVFIIKFYMWHRLGVKCMFVSMWIEDIGRKSGVETLLETEITDILTFM